MLLHLNLYFTKCSSILSFQFFLSAIEISGESQTWKKHGQGKIDHSFIVRQKCDERFFRQNVSYSLLRLSRIEPNRESVESDRIRIQG